MEVNIDGQVITFDDSLGVEEIQRRAQLYREQQQQQQQPPAGHDFNAMNMLRNIPGSAKSMAQGMWDAATSPVDTARGMGGLAMGANQKFHDITGLSPIGAAADYLGQDFRPQVEAMGQFYGDRYGSIDQAQRTLEEDPVGALLDATGAAGALGKTGQIATQIAIPKALPRSLMKSASKFSKTIAPGDEASMIDLMLEKGINPSGRGVRKLDDLITSQGTIVDDLIAQADSAGGTVAIGDVLRDLNKLKQERGGSLVSGQQDLAAIDAQIQVFLENARAQGKTQLTASELQSFKRDLYDRIAWDARRGTDVTPVQEDIYKSTARSTRSKIDEIAPGTNVANKEFGRLLELKPHLERSARRIEDRDWFGLGSGLATGGGLGVGAATGSPIAGLAVAGIMELFNNPRMSPTVARGLEYLRKPGPVRENFNKWVAQNPAPSANAIADHLEQLVDENAAGRAYYDEERGALED